MREKNKKGVKGGGASSEYQFQRAFKTTMQMTRLFLF